METLLQLVLGVALLATLLVVAGVLAVKYFWRRAKRAATRWALGIPARVAARPVSSFVWVRAALPGPGRSVALARRDVGADIAGAARAVEAGRQAGRPVENLVPLVRQLSAQARALDVDLLVVASEPDPAVRRRLLAAQDGRIRLLRKACGEVRHGVLLAGAATNAAQLDALVTELGDEVTAIGLRARAYRELV